jgi:hypothetical protein
VRDRNTIQARMGSPLVGLQEVLAPGAGPDREAGARARERAAEPVKALEAAFRCDRSAAGLGHAGGGDLITRARLWDAVASATEARA